LTAPTNEQAAKAHVNQGLAHLVHAKQSMSVGDARLASKYARQAAQAFDVAATFLSKKGEAPAGKPSRGQPIPLSYVVPAEGEGEE